MSAAEGMSVEDGFWRQVFDQASAPLAIIDMQGRYEYVNPALCELLGYPAEQLCGRDYRDVTHPDDIDLGGPRAADEPLEKRYVRSDGSVIWTLVSRAYIRDSTGTVTHLLSQIQDITERRELEEQWRRSFANAPIGMAVLDLDGRWSAVNEELAATLGYEREELLGKSVWDLTYELDDERGRDEFHELVKGQTDTVTVEKRFRRKNGRPIWVFLRATTVPDADGSPAFIISQYESIGERRLVDAHLAHLALHDPLTGLANRVLLEDRMEQYLKQIGSGCAVLGVLLADLDRLKPINDRYGHAHGDRLLMTAAQQLQRAVRSGDTVARLGGDEFVVLSLVPDEEAAGALRERVASYLDTELIIAGEVMEACASVGLATTRDPQRSATELLHSADLDMYERKRQR
ncbi:PAS domain S-box protein [Salinifilum ghardaiensis]